MNKNKIRKYQIFSIIFTFILGVLLQFTYKLSGGNQVVAIFSSINKSSITVFVILQPIALNF